MTPTSTHQPTVRELQLLRWFGRADFQEQVLRRQQVEQVWWRMRQGCKQQRQGRR